MTTPLPVFIPDVPPQVPVTPAPSGGCPPAFLGRPGADAHGFGADGHD